jgi:hypothetical protein
MRAITRLKGVITPRIFGKGKKSIELETVVSDCCFFNGRFWLCHKKIVRAQKQTNDPFKNETREREKELGEQNFSELAIAC